MDNYESSATGPSIYKMLTVLNGGGASTCTFTGLLKYTKYEFFIVPFYKTVDGKPSNSKIGRTLEDGKSGVELVEQHVSNWHDKFLVPAEPPTQMEALLLNSSAVFLKWKPPALKTQNGLLMSYFVIVRGVDTSQNVSRILTNVTIDAATPTLLLANLTWGVTYTVSVAAANNAGLGPFSAPAPLRLDPKTKRLDQTLSHRYVVQRNSC